MKGCLKFVGVALLVVITFGFFASLADKKTPNGEPASYAAGKAVREAVIGVDPAATATPRPVPTRTLNEIKMQAFAVTYDLLMRTPEQFDGRPIRFRGEVIQTGTQSVWLGDDYGWLRIRMDSENTSDVSAGFSSDAVYVRWNHDNRILTGDTVEVFGLGDGRISYKTVLGAEMTIPQIDARAVTVISE